MKYKDKTREELINELHELQQQNDMLKASLNDIAERKEDEEPALENEDVLSVIFQTIPDPIAIIRVEDNVCVKINTGFTNIIGWKEDEILGKSFKDFDVWVDFEDRVKMVDLLKKDGQFNCLEARIRCKNGEIITSLFSSKIITIKNAPCIISVIRDITEHKRIEEELRESKLNEQFIIENTDDILWVMNPDFTFAHVSPSVYKFLGYTVEEHMKQSLEDYLSPESTQMIKEEFQEGMMNLQKKEYHKLRNVVTKEIEFIKKDKTRGIGIITIIMVRDEQYRIKKIRGKTTDITERRRTEEALKESAKKWQLTFDGIKDSIFLLDTKGKILQANEISCDLFGKKEEEIINHYCYDTVHACHFHIDGCPLVRMKISRQRETMLMPVNDKWFEVTVDPIFDERNSITGAVHIVSDITKRKLAEKELIQSEAKFHSIFDQSSVGLLIVGLDNRFIRCNRAFCNFLGYAEEELIGKTIADVTHPEDIELGMKELKLIAANQMESFILQKRYLKKNGEFLWAEVHICLVRDEENKPLFFLPVIKDISKRKQFENALQESKKNLQLAQHLSKVGSWQWTVATDTVKWSEELYQITGRDVKLPAPNYKELSSFYTTESWERLSEAVAEALQSGKSYELELENVMPDGTIKPTYSFGEADYDANNKVIGLHGAVQDITDRKQAEKALITAKEKAEESDRLKTAFLANMSHEIRTPMNGILGFAEQLKQRNLTSEEQEYVTIISKSGKRMLNIINDIISLSKVESGQMEITISETNINEQLTYIYDFFKLETEQKGITFSYKNALPAEKANIITDSEIIYSILTNLVKNAIKFTKEGAIEFGYILKNHRDTPELEFYVKDTGIGIREEHKGFIFERFRQGSDLLTRNYEGAGLGLSISKAYVEKLGGKLWVESEYGKGSVFYFTIPYNAVESEKEKDKRDVILPDNEGQQIKNLKILIADDDEISQKLITIVIKLLCKEIIKAKTGAEAIEACRNNPDIDLVLIDIKMPEIDGYEATKKIRQFNKEVIIIAQTAFGLTGDREKAIDAGCNDYILKPINQTLLLGLIKKHLKNENINC